MPTSNFGVDASIVRRTDVALRAQYPFLITRIFEVALRRYRIVFSETQLHASLIQENFNKEIRPVAFVIEISNEEPKEYLREIGTIPDSALSHGFEGLALSTRDLNVILLSKFRELPQLRGTSHREEYLVLTFEGSLSKEQEDTVRTFMAGHLPGWPIEFASDPSRKDIIGNSDSWEKLQIRPAQVRSISLPFVKEDEDFWYQNVDQIFGGQITSRQILGMEVGAACYLDASSSPQIDLRQAILFYDMIYLTPPLHEERRVNFWERQALSQEDVLKLVDAGRLKLVLAQPEERTDVRFLEAVYERDPKAVLGRLTSAALIATDIVETANEYTLAKPEYHCKIDKLIELVTEATSLPLDNVARLILWPLHARRSCLAPLMARGLLGIGAFSQGDILADELKVFTNRDLKLEALFAADGVHVAHALGATFIPPTEEMEGWVDPRRIMGDRLNFYRSLNGRIAASWAGNEKRKSEGRTILPPIPLFKFERYAPVEHLIAATSLSSVRRRGRALVTRLSELPEEDRAVEVERMARELYDLSIKQDRKRLILDTAHDALEIAGYASYPIKAGWNLLNTCLSLARRVPALDGLVDAIEQSFSQQYGKNSDIDFLSKVSRVAKLRDD